MSLDPDRAPRAAHDPPVGPSQVSRLGADPDAFEVFYREQVLAVERFVARRVRDPHLVADLTAEVFLAAITSATGYRAERGTPSAWLFGIAHHVIADHHRHAARQRRLADRVSGRAVLDSCGESAIERLTERIDAERRARPLLAVLDGLHPTAREILLLVEVDELTAAEAAAVLGISPLAARVRLHRARRALAARLDSGGSDPAPARATDQPLHEPLQEGDRP